MKVNLEGKVALVTGAARGIGQSIASALANNGASVICTDRDFEMAHLSAAKFPGAVAMRMDVTSEAEIDSVMTETLKRWGHLDILVNNAGVNTLNHRVNIDQFPTDEWERILRVDLTGLFQVSRAAARAMLAQKSGRIINISSVLGLGVGPPTIPVRRGQGWRGEPDKGDGSGIGRARHPSQLHRSSSILTDGSRELFYGANGKFSDRAQAVLSHIPLGRPGSCEEVAHVALFLAAPESSYLNGTVLTVDGGWLAGYIRDF